MNEKEINELAKKNIETYHKIFSEKNLAKEGWKKFQESKNKPEDEGDIDSLRELERERKFDYIQRSIETCGDT